MREYQIQIKEIFIKTVTVEARHAAEAREIAERNWKSGDYIFDADHFESVIFTVPTRTEWGR